MYETGKTLINLIRSVLRGDSFEVNKADVEKIMAVAKSHSLTYFTATALSAAGISVDRSVILAEVAKIQRQDAALATFCKALEEAGIDHIALKGSVIRRLYPEPYMRSSCDIDILVKEDDLERAKNVILSVMPCGNTDKRFHDIKFIYGDGLVLELHFSLNEENEHKNAVLSRVWNNVNLIDGTNHSYKMTNEFFMFHLIAHAAYHFVSGGCGIRPFIDLYIIDKSLEFDRENVLDLCRESGLYTFAVSAYDLMQVWFCDKTHNYTTQMMEKYLLPTGTFGNLSNKMAMYEGMHGSKRRYIVRQVFPPVKDMALPYPILKKWPALLPAMWFARWVRLLFSKRTAKGMKKIKVMVKNPKENGISAGQMLTALGLINNG